MQPSRLRGTVWCAGLALLMAVSARAESLPEMYKSVDRVIWVVKDVSAVAKAWEQLGLAGVVDEGAVDVSVRYQGQERNCRWHVLTGYLGNLGIEMIQPVASGEPNAPQDALVDFSKRHGDGVFSVVHAAHSAEAAAGERNRMGRLGVEVLEIANVRGRDGESEFTFFNTEPEGKYVLGLVTGPKLKLGAPGVVSHLAFVIRKAQPVSDYWASLGFPALRVDHATPREDSRYRGKPLLLSFDVGWQKHTQFTYEWLIPPDEPPNVYVDYLRLHGEGLQHIGLPVPDLPAAFERYRALGYGVWQSGAWGDIGKPKSGQYGYMETDRVGGVTAELIHAY